MSTMFQKLSARNKAGKNKNLVPAYKEITNNFKCDNCYNKG